MNQGYQAKTIKNDLPPMHIHHAAKIGRRKVKLTGLTAESAFQIVVMGGGWRDHQTLPIKEVTLITFIGELIVNRK